MVRRVGEDVGIEATGEDAADDHPDLGNSAEKESGEEGEGVLSIGSAQGKAEGEVGEDAEEGDGGDSGITSEVGH